MTDELRKQLQEARIAIQKIESDNNTTYNDLIYQFSIEIDKIKNISRQIHSHFLCDKTETIHKNKDSASYTLRIEFPILWSRFNLFLLSRPCAWIGFEASIKFVLLLDKKSGRNEIIHSIRHLKAYFETLEAGGKRGTYDELSGNSSSEVGRIILKIADLRKFLPNYYCENADELIKAIGITAAFFEKEFSVRKR